MATCRRPTSRMLPISNFPSCPSRSVSSGRKSLGTLNRRHARRRSPGLVCTPTHDPLPHHIGLGFGEALDCPPTPPTEPLVWQRPGVDFGCLSTVLYFVTARSLGMRSINRLKKPQRPLCALWKNGDFYLSSTKTSSCRNFPSWRASTSFSRSSAPQGRSRSALQTSNNTSCR